MPGLRQLTILCLVCNPLGLLQNADGKLTQQWETFLPRDESHIRSERGDATVSCPSVRLSVCL